MYTSITNAKAFAEKDLGDGMLLLGDCETRNGRVVRGSVIVYPIHGRVVDLSVFPIKSLVTIDGVVYAPEVFQSSKDCRKYIEEAYTSPASSVCIKRGIDVCTSESEDVNTVHIYGNDAPYTCLYVDTIIEAYYVDIVGKKTLCAKTKRGTSFPLYMLESGNNILQEHILAHNTALKTMTDPINQIEDIRKLYASGGINGYTQEDDALYIQDILKGDSRPTSLADPMTKEVKNKESAIDKLCATLEDEEIPVKDLDAETIHVDSEGDSVTILSIEEIDQILEICRETALSLNTASTILKEREPFYIRNAELSEVLEDEPYDVIVDKNRHETFLKIWDRVKDLGREEYEGIFNTVEDPTGYETPFRFIINHTDIAFKALLDRYPEVTPDPICEEEKEAVHIKAEASYTPKAKYEDRYELPSISINFIGNRFNKAK